MHERQPHHGPLRCRFPELSDVGSISNKRLLFLFQWSSAEQVFAAAATSSSLLLKGGVWVLGLSAWHAAHLHIASDVPECIIDFCGALVCAICAAALVAAVPSSVC